METKTFEQLPYKLEDTYILQFGTFYFYETFVVSEIQKGISFDKKMAEMVIELIDNHYGKEANIGYISNRIYDYSVSTRAWYKFFEIRYRVKAYAIVSQKKQHPILCALKKLTYKQEKCRYSSLLEAASWLTSLHVLQSSSPEFRQKMKIASLQKRNYFL